LPKTAVITGVTGQDGSYLAELLLAKGYEVHGLVRSAAGKLKNAQKNSPRHAQITYHAADLSDRSALEKILDTVKPDEIYNLAAQSQVGASFANAELTADTNAMGALRLLEALRIKNLVGTTRFCQAGTAEMFGRVGTGPRKESGAFFPESPYAVSKVFAHWMTVNYRETYGIFACNAILFNHESPRRSEAFVSRKITRAVAAISRGQQACLALGNLNATRDWGHARDYVEGMWLTLQAETAGDYVFATGVSRSVRAFVELAFAQVNTQLHWEGAGLAERGICQTTGRALVVVDARYFRPEEPEAILGDASKAKQVLGWQAKTRFEELVAEMVAAEFMGTA
jgi:GDPmannose 4,6-dehydratase